MKTILILAVIILIVNILSLDFDNILSIKENRTEYITIVISVLATLAIFFHYKEKNKK